ncbi:hypothetical protein GCM10027085_29420 [Spirosoma aerophilum]
MIEARQDNVLSQNNLGSNGNRPNHHAANTNQCIVADLNLTNSVINDTKIVDDTSFAYYKPIEG